MMAEMPKAQGGGANQYVVWGSENPAPTLASQCIDKNLAKRAMTSKSRVLLDKISAGPRPKPPDVTQPDAYRPAFEEIPGDNWKTM
jgi:hypothetical protein